MSLPTIESVTCGRRLGADATTIAAPARLRVADGRIAAIEPAAGDEGVFALPALANAHDHGGGLRPAAYGAFDQALETWLTALYTHPPVDPFLNAAVAFGRMARSGIGLVVHCHMPIDPTRQLDEAIAVCRAAETIGIRLAFVVPMRDRARFGYFGDETVLGRLPAWAADEIRGKGLAPFPPVADQLALVDAIAQRCTSALVQVQYGPGAPHWCSDAMLEAIADASRRTGRRIHMHCLETRYQREFADAAYPDGLVPFLDRIGFLSERLTLAHGVYLDDAEIALLAARDVIVSINTCSNLRLRSGIAPAPRMLAARLPVALGIDALGLDDEEDGLRELRLAYLMHAGVGFDERLTKAALLAAALSGRAITGRRDHGALVQGAPADVLLLNWDALSADAMPGITPDLELVLARATARAVKRLVVAGREVFADGALRGIDLAAAEAELYAQARAAAPDWQRRQPALAALQAELRACYAEGLHRRIAF